MPSLPDPSRRMVLTRRGRLLRTILVLCTVGVLVALLVLLMRPSPSPGAAQEDRASDGASDPQTSSTADDSTADDPVAEASATTEPSDAGGSSEAPEAEPAQREDGIVRTSTVGDGTWTIAEPVGEQSAPEGSVHRYALRVEDGIGIDPGEAAAQVAGILADERGWQATDEVRFEQVDDPEQADVTFSIAAPPTVDELCAPARTNGVWSCRIDEDVVLNSDRWLHMTPTFEDIDEYRAYMVNHEVGHFLGYGHVDCGGDGQPAPVMLQQSMDLQGCTPTPGPRRRSRRDVPDEDPAPYSTHRAPRHALLSR